MRTSFRLFCLLVAMVPLYFGSTQLIHGAGDVSPALDSQFRYMSGLYVAIGIGMLWVAWKAEQAAALFTVLVLAAFLGGVGRLISLGDVGLPNPKQNLGMYVELSMPLLLLWLWAIRRNSHTSA